MRPLACGCVLACRVEPSRDSWSQHNRKPAGAALIAGEASSNTFTSANGIYLRGFRGATPFAEWAGAAGTNATLPALLREAQPYLRLILMLRDPVTRYYSAFHYYRWWLKEERPPTPDDFHETVLKEVQEWKDCVAARSVPDCVRSFKPQQLIKGMYAQFLPVSGGVFITECWLHGVPVGVGRSACAGVAVWVKVQAQAAFASVCAAALLLRGRTGCATGRDSSCWCCATRTTLPRSRSTSRQCWPSWMSPSLQMLGPSRQ